jgi:sugar/nucleoside kinase (ribokinase family)
MFINRLKKNFLVIGPTLLDINTTLSSIRSIRSVPVHISPGGKGYNIAHTMALFRVPVVLATAYGHDYIGGYLAKRIRGQGIKTLHTNTVDFASGIFVGISDGAGESIFAKAEIDIYAYQQKPSIDWRQIDTVIVLSSTNKTVMDYLRKIRKGYKNINFCLEISGGKTISSIMPYLNMFDFYISNYKEAQYLGAATQDKNNLTQIIKFLINKGLKQVFITLNQKGIIYGYNSNMGETIIKRHPIIRNRGPIISTVGAGDTVTAVLCVAIFAFGLTINNSVRLAMEMAAWVIRQPAPHLKFIPKDFSNKIKRLAV